MYALFVAFGSIIVFFRRINTFPLRNWDEAWYAEASKNMASGHYGYLMQFWNGRFYFDHSPLYFWLSIPFFKFFGPGEWQARIVSTTAAVVATFLVYLIGKKLVNARTGFVSAIVFLTFGGVVMRFAHGNLDSLLVCLFLAAFYFYLRSTNKLIFSVLCGTSVGLGILVKSWGIGLFPLYWIVAYSLFVEKKLPKRFGLVITCATIAFSWWYVLGIFNFGNAFVNWYILNPSEGRLNSPFSNFSLDYYGYILEDIGLWAIPLIIYAAFFTKIKKVDQYVVPFLIVAFSYVTALNFLSDKSDWYLIAAYPLLAIVLGGFIARLVEFKKIIFIAVFVLLTLAGWWNTLRVENRFPDRSTVGAELGVKADELIPFGEEVILDDHDFTSFLYYSNQNHIYTLQDNRKPGEWWILKREEIPDFLASNPKSWIVTRNPEGFNGLVNVDHLGGYTFLRSY